jgi:hypothetical protein
MDTKTSPVSPKCWRRSSFVVGNMFVFVLVNPLSATPLFSPSSLARAACAVRPRGFHAAGSESRTSPKSAARRLLGNAPYFPLFSTDLSAMASPTLVIDPSDVARRVVESTTHGLYGVAANGLTKCMFVCMCMWLQNVVELWVEVGQQSNSS